MMINVEAPQVELLAPAGNMACLHAAVRAGADAVYLGAGEFNARRGADNFTLDELARACDFAHLRGVAVYLTLNTIVLPSEVEDALELALQAWRAGVDAYIVQDLGLVAKLARVLPEAPVHTSTQMNIHDADGIRAAAALGASRVTLARELSLKEIEKLHALAREIGVELEVFAHGALCVCYSGQCFMSSMVGGRSANRGRCAQACRLPYELHNRALRKSLPSPGEHLLSPKDLCTVDLLPELIEAGASSLKIEGRMKSPEYVSAVVGVYRAVLDRALAYVAEAARAEADCGSVEMPCAEPICPRATEAEHATLAEAFSRGFTTAYLEGARGNEIMSYGRPNNRGVRAGRVTGVRDGRVFIAPEVELVRGDVIEFWTNRGHFTHVVGEVRTGRAGDVVIEGVERAVGKGDRVFRVRSAEAAFVDSDRDPAVPVEARVSLRIGQPARMEVAVPFLAAQSCENDAFAKSRGCRPWAARARQGAHLQNDDNPASSHMPNVGDSLPPQVPHVSVEGPVVEPARTKALTEDEVRDHIDRMGTTPFYLARLDIELDEGVGMGFSTLHKLRAQAAEALETEILRPYRARILERTPAARPVPVARRGACKVFALATNPACARAAKKAGAEALYVPAANYRRGEALIAGQLSPTAEQAGYPKQCVPVLPCVSHAHDEEDRNGFDIWAHVREGKPVMVENIGQLAQAVERGAEAEVGPHIPVTNRLDAQLMAKLGAQRIWLSPELSLVQIEELGEVSPVPLGLTVMGQQELMVTEHCLLMSQGPCNQDCVNCARRKSPHYLKDRKGYEMPVVTDCTGRSHLYNAVQLDIANNLPELIAAGVSAVLVDTTMMNVAETSQAVGRAVRARDIAQKSGDRVSKKEGTTSGHLFRGVS